MFTNLEREIVLKLLNCILYNKKIDSNSIQAIDSVHYRHYSNIVQKIADMLKLEAMIRRYIKDTETTVGAKSPSRVALSQYYNGQLTRLRAAISKTNENAKETQSVIYFYFFLRPYYTEIIYIAKQITIIKNAIGGLISTLLRRIINTGSELEVKFCKEAIKAVEIPIYKTLTLWVNKGLLVSEGNEESYGVHSNNDFFIKLTKEGDFVLVENLIPSSIPYQTAMVVLNCGKLLVLLKNNFIAQEIQTIMNDSIVEISVNYGEESMHRILTHRYFHINKKIMELLRDVYDLDKIIGLTKNQLCFMDSSYSEALLMRFDRNNVLKKLGSSKAHIMKREFNDLQEKSNRKYGALKKVLKICHEDKNNNFIFYFSLKQTPIVRILYTEEDLRNLETISKLLVAINQFCFLSRKFHSEFIIPLKKAKLTSGSKFIIQHFNKLHYIYTSLFETLGVYRIEMGFYKLNKKLKHCTDLFDIKQQIANAILEMKENFTKDYQNAYWQVLRNLDKTLGELEEFYKILMELDTSSDQRKKIIIENIESVSSAFDIIFNMFFVNSKTRRHNNVDFLDSFLNFSEYFTNKRKEITN